MATTTEDLSTVNATQPTAPSVAPGTTVDTATYQQMLNILDELVNHTHIFYDDYNTACNCNCNCACGRGIL
jgi:hypothetical protein